MKRLSEAHAADFAMLLDRVRALGGFACAREAAQAFVTILYDHFRESFVLLRLFTTVRYDELPLPERQFVDRRGNDAGIAHLIDDRTPVLTWLGSRGEHADWQERQKSQRFRCIPLASGAFVASLSMLAAQLRSMAFDPALIDSWDTAVVAGGADRYAGLLHIRDAASDRDAQGRLIVPMQEFVALHNVRTVLGFGTGYGNHPTLVTLFAFTNETLDREAMAPFAALLQAYLTLSQGLVAQGRVFD